MLEKLKERIKNLKSRTPLYCAAGLLLVLLVAGLCLFFYSKGIADGRGQSGRPEHMVSREAPKPVVRSTTDSARLLEEGMAAVVSDAAVASNQAVLAEAATSEAASAENQAESAGTALLPQQNSSEKNPQGGSTAAGNSHTAAAVPASGSTYAGKLSVVGSQLCTADGTPIQLRGVSTHGLGWYPQYVNAAMFGELKAWGANTVRLAMYTAEYNGYCSGGDRSQLKELIKKGVEYATQQNLYVIIDWHILSDGNPNTHKAEAVDFFAEMAELYKDNDHVLYEICNEPNGGVGWGEIKSYANEVIAVIRARDPDGVILVGTPTWSQEVDQAAADPITGYSNIMYTLHYYANTHRESLRNTLTKAAGNGLPVFVSEFGICDASGNGGINIEQADLWIQTLNQYGISYVAWNLSNKAETCALIQSGCSKTSGITEGDLSESGRWLLKTLQGSTGASAGGAGGSVQNPSAGQTGSSQQPVPEQGSAAQPSQPDHSWQQPAKDPQQFTPQPSGGVEAVAVNSWQEGNAFCIQYEIKVANTTGGVQEGWNASLTFPVNAQVVSGWNASFSASGSTVSFSAMDYNKIIQPGSKAEGIGCIIRFE